MRSYPKPYPRISTACSCRGVAGGAAHIADSSTAESHIADTDTTDTDTADGVPR